MAHALPYLYKSMLNEPLLITEQGLHSVMDFLESREVKEWALDFSGGPTRQPQADTSEGSVAQINLMGPMMHRATALESMCGAQSYETYRRQVDAAFANPAVETIVLYLDSPGGAATGLFDLAQHIYNKKVDSGKHVVAFVDGMAASAAYALAVTADKVFVEGSSSVGSIGVITTHVDMSKKLEKDGVTVTPIYAGKFKAAGNPFEELSDETKAMIQERVDALYTNFVQHVAEMRGLSEQAVRDTEAKVFLAEEAVELGLADGIMSVDEFMAYLENDEDNMPISFSKQKPQEKAVSNQDELAVKLEAMEAKLAEYEGTKATYEAKQAEMAQQLEAAQALVKQKEEAEYAAKLEGFKEKAQAWTSFGVDAEAFAAKAMEADSDFVAMVTSALDASQAKLEETALFEEKGVEAEGEGVEAKAKDSPVMSAIKTKFSKESK